MSIEHLHRWRIKSEEWKNSKFITIFICIDCRKEKKEIVDKNGKKT